MHVRNWALLFTIAALGAGCTWVKLDDAAGSVRVAYDGRVDGCKPMGEIGVSVKDHVGPYERSGLKVKDELETLARNEAASMRADTIRATSEPNDGEQRFAAYSCGQRAHSERRSSEPKRDAANGTETFPVKDH